LKAVEVVEVVEVVDCAGKTINKGGKPTCKAGRSTREGQGLQLSQFSQKMEDGNGGINHADRLI